MQKLFPLALCFLLSPYSLRAQGIGTLIGTGTDPTRAVVPNAKVVVTNQGTQLSRSVASNEQGYYVIPSLQPATYDLAVEASGFAAYAQRGVAMLADQSLTVNVSLTVRQAASQVTVEASAVQVNTSNSTLSQVVEQKRIVDLPLNGRNAQCP